MRYCLLCDWVCRVGGGVMIVIKSILFLIFYEVLLEFLSLEMVVVEILNL